MCLTPTTVRPRLSEQLGVSLLCTDHTVCVSHPLQSYLVYPNNLVSLYSVLTILYVSHIHYTQTSFIRTTWCLSTLYWSYCMCLTSTTLRPRLSEQLGVSLLCTGHTVSHIHYSQTSFIRTTWCLSTLYWPYCMCLTSTTVRPRLSEQLGVSLLCTGHTVCVSHPLVRPRLSEQLGVSLLCTGHTVCVSHPLHSDLVYPNNLVSLYPVLTILYVSHIHYTQTSFIRTTWCLSTLY